MDYRLYQEQIKPIRREDEAETVDDHIHREDTRNRHGVLEQEAEEREPYDEAVMALHRLEARRRRTGSRMLLRASFQRCPRSRGTTGSRTGH